jgi:hypothetical protein
LGATYQRIARYVKLSIKRAHKLSTVKIVHPGAITVIQRAGTDLDANLHFHSLFTNGAFVRLAGAAELTFLEIPPPTDDDIADIAWGIAKAVRKVFWRMNCWEDLPDQEDRVISGMLVTRGKRAIPCRFTGVAANAAAPPDGVGAINVDASRAIGRGDHENLCRVLAYMLSPAIRDKQLTVRSDDVILELKRPRTDGTTHRRLTFDQLLSRLAYMVHPRYANMIRFHGVYAPNAKLRENVVPQSPAVADGPAAAAAAAVPDDDASALDHQAWAELKTHSFPGDMMRCPNCGGRLKLVELTTDRITYRRGRTSPDRGPPQKSGV